MGVLHNELEGSVLGRTIRAILGIKEGEKTIERFGETLTPTLDMWSRPEFAALRGEKKWSVFDQVVAVAAKNSAAGIINPAGSGMLVCVETWNLQPASTASFEWAITTEAALAAVLTSSSNAFARDLRMRANVIGQSKTVAQFVRGTNAGIVGTVVQNTKQASPNTGVSFPAWFLLPPGFAVAVWCLTVNVTCEFSITGWERKASAGELTFGVV